MPIVGATINMTCPTCGAAFDVQLEDVEPKETPYPQIHKTISYRCHACEHLGEVQVEIQTR